MDYIESFKNLRTNNKYGRKSHHKAVMMLTVIELFEKNILTDNEIYYNDTLKSMFQKVWNKVLPKEPLFHPEAYLPFWYLQNDSFWHIVPVRGKEDILSLMRDANIKPSEAKLNDSVKCAEMDEDLYFLMTIASGRSSLKRALLETYTTLSERQIDSLSKSSDNVVDHSISAMNEYEEILSSAKNDDEVMNQESSNELIQQFRKLSDDLQIALNYEYYSFLKSHRSERGMLREICPDVYTLYDHIVNHPIHRTYISPSFSFTYENFLSDLKIALMSENSSIDLIDKIDGAIAVLRGDNTIIDLPKAEEEDKATDVIEEQGMIPIESGEIVSGDSEVEHVYLDVSGNIEKIVTSSRLDDSPKEEVTENRRGKAWTEEEENILTRYFKLDVDIPTIAERFGRTEGAIKARLAKLGLIEYVYEKEETVEKTVVDEPYNQDDFQIQNSFTRCHILNKDGEKVFSADGKLIYISGRLYRLNLKRECFTLKSMHFNGSFWHRGEKKIVAYPNTTLYKVIDSASDYSLIIEDIVDSDVYENCKLRVNGIWFKYNGELLSDYTTEQKEEQVKEQKDDEINITQERNMIKIMGNPLYAVRKQSILRAMGFFRLPVKIKDIARTISRTAWGDKIKEEDVEDIIKTMSEVDSVEGKFILRKRK